MRKTIKERTILALQCHPRTRNPVNTIIKRVVENAMVGFWGVNWYPEIPEHVKLRLRCGFAEEIVKQDSPIHDVVVTRCERVDGELKVDLTVVLNLEPVQLPYSISIAGHVRWDEPA